MKTFILNVIWYSIWGFIAPIAFLLGVLSLVFNFLSYHLQNISRWLFVLLEYIGIKIYEM